MTTSPSDKKYIEGTRRHFTEAQLVIGGIWLGLPIIAFVLLWLINPGYEGNLFAPDSFFTGVTLLLGCAGIEAINALALYLGFRGINRALPEDGSRRLGRAALISLLAILTFLLCTLPILMIVLLCPAALIISRTR